MVNTNTISIMAMVNTILNKLELAKYSNDPRIIKI